jgi:hypothetical protein
MGLLDHSDSFFIDWAHDAPVAQNVRYEVCRQYCLLAAQSFRRLCAAETADGGTSWIGSAQA